MYWLYNPESTIVERKANLKLLISKAMLKLNSMNNTLEGIGDKGGDQNKTARDAVIKIIII